MLTIPLSKLETARANPASYARSLIDQAVSSGGSVGFVGSWKTIVRSHHENDEEFSLSLKKLEDKLYISFKDTPQNRSRSTKFSESFKSYVDAFEKLNLSIDKFQINLKWPIIPKALLTGFSPFLCSNEECNIAYFFQEQGGDWQTHIKFPLLQIHLAEQFYKCDVSNLKVGIYNITEKKFDLKTFEDFELDNALGEGKQIFKTVNDIYGGFKK